MAKKTKAAAIAANPLPSAAFNQFEPNPVQWNPYNARARVYASKLAYSDKIKEEINPIAASHCRHHQNKKRLAL